MGYIHCSYLYIMKDIKSSIEQRIRQLNWSTSYENITNLVEPCIRISSKGQDTMKVGRSKIGGLPDLPKSAEWPKIKGKPLAFLGQIGFAEVHEAIFVPDALQNKLVSFYLSVHYEDYRELNPSIHAVVITDLHGGEEVVSKAFPEALETSYRFDQKELEFKPSFSLPSYQHWKVEDLQLNAHDEELYADEVSEIINDLLGLGYQPGHQLFGYSDAIQGDVNHRWASKYLDGAFKEYNQDVQDVEKRFHQLMQFDLMLDFPAISDGCAYYGYMPGDHADLKIQCELQNT